MIKSKIICMQNTLQVLRYCAMFPPKGSELNLTKSYYLKFAFLLIISSVPVIGSALHLVKSIKANISVTLDSDLLYTLSWGSIYFYASFCVFKTPAMVELYTFLSDFEDFGKPEEFDKENKFYDRLSMYYYIYLESLVICQLIYSTYLNFQNCEKLNAQYNLDEVCGLYTFTAMPFDFNYFPAKQIILFFELFGTHYLHMVGGMTVWYIAETVEHIRIRFRHVNRLFRKALQEKDAKESRKMFNFAVRYHSSLFILEDKVNDAFGIFMFSHLGISAPIIGIGVFSILSGGLVSLFMVCLAWIVGLIATCFSGQWLQDECLAVGLDLYQADWSHCPEDMKKDIMFVIRRSWTPICLRAMSFGIMDYNMFVAVLKGTYSYINLLTQR